MDWEVRWQIYIIKEALPTTKYIKLVRKKEFTPAALNLEYEIFIVHVTFLSFTFLDVYPFCRLKLFGLIAKKAPIKVPDKYINFADVLSPGLAFKLLKHIKINDYAIELVNSQQLPYGPIYSLELVELETLKAYIEINLANGFIRPSKSPVDVPILFDRKLDRFLWLYVNYRDLHNLTIKNWYPLLLVGELLDRLGGAK